MVNFMLSKGMIETILDLSLRKIVCWLGHPRQTEHSGKRRKENGKKQWINLPEANVSKKECNKRDPGEADGPNCGVPKRI